MPIATARALNRTAPPRIRAVWALPDAGDSLAGVGYQCTSVGAPISALTAGGYYAPWDAASFPSSPSPCPDAAHVVGGATAGGVAKLAILKGRTDAAVAFWARALQIKPVADASLVVASGVAAAFGLAQLAYPATDLVVIMTARPSPASPILGYASCLQYDQRGRCTVAHFNWVPEQVMGPSATNLDVTIQAEMYTALHEMLHVLGFMGPGVAPYSPFLDATTGAQLTSGVFLVEPDPAFGGNKQRTVMTTPRVRNFTRAYLNCSSAPGFPLEDLPLGRGVHWESRVAGPELMSYGLNSGQIYLSDLTLALLEDTNQYIADYSVAGLIHGTSLQDSFATFSFLASANAGDPGYTPPPPPPPGRLRWGFMAGCSFLNAHPNVGWPADHTCATAGDFTCTADAMMSANCVIEAGYLGPYQSYGGFSQSSGGAQLTSQTAAGLPSWLAFFTTDAAAAAAAGTSGATSAGTGGYQASMDYVPVPVGYWSHVP